MRTLARLTVCLAVLMGAACARDTATVIADAQEALGGVTAVTYSGSARDVAFQQCGASAASMQCQGTHDPMRPIADYVRVIDLSAPLSRHTGTTSNIGPGGSTAITPGTFFQQVTPEQADVSQPWGGSLELYLTPWGFLHGAAANNATMRTETIDGRELTVLSWSPTVTAPSGGSYMINGYLNDDNLVERVETWLGENIMGDMHIVADYSGYQNFGGAMAPSTIVQTRGGWPFFEVDVTSAEGNPADVASIAAAPAPAGGGPGRGGAPGGGRGGGRGGGGAPPEPTVTAEQLGEGLYRLTTGTGSYDSLIVEFDDHIMMLEAGGSEAVMQAYVAEAKRLMSDKPIRYIMNTHPHSDHTRGLPALVAEGATIVTHENNAEFFERALNTPRTLLDDALARNPLPATVDPVGDMKVYTDGTRTVELYHAWPVPHSNGLLVAYFPQEKVLFQGDFSLPAPGQPANDHVKALAPVLEALGLDFDRYINVHASAEPQNRAELMRAVEARMAADKQASN